MLAINSNYKSFILKYIYAYTYVYKLYKSKYTKMKRLKAAYSQKTVYFYYLIYCDPVFELINLCPDQLFFLNHQSQS